MSKKINIVKNDPWLEPFQYTIEKRYNSYLENLNKIESKHQSVSNFATGYLYFGIHKNNSNWIIREWAPNAIRIFLVCESNNWQEKKEYELSKIENGNWELFLSLDKLKHGELFKLSIHWKNGQGYRIPAYIKRVIQNENTKNFDAQVWFPEKQYQWKYSPLNTIHKNPIIYEAHVGMASEEEKTGTFNEFRTHILPIIKDAGYNTIQLMAIQEHPYYGSFGYHVSNFFAVSSRFGTPEELKELIDEAHRNNIAVIMDLVHSHSIKNELEGLGLFDGTPYQYFHGGIKREHVAWDSLCFNYGKDEVLHFLLSNCKFWLEEYKFDGFRFDGITSMLYYDHGLSKNFNNYQMYFDGNQDEDAILYLSLANKLIHDVNQNALTIAEEMSGYPGLAEPISDGGCGFDFRLSMGIPDYWIKIIKERADENWNVNELFHELTSKRQNERTVSYAESHDQALVGDKTIIFRLIDKDMYYHMNKSSQNIIIERGLALHKMIRLITIATAGGGYLNFMGNEFGHPEWIDFPREGNNWSYKYARRQWHLQENMDLRYHFLSDFDKDMINLFKKENCLAQVYCNFIMSNEGDQVLAFERKNLLFIFNFNPLRSYTDYGFPAPSGKYKIVLNSDSEKYGGFGNIDETLTYFSKRDHKISENNYLKVYLPPRIAIVMKKIPTPSIY